MRPRRTFRERPRSLYSLANQPRSNVARLSERRAPIKRKSQAIEGFTLEAKGEDRCRVCGAQATELHHAVPRSLSRAGRADLRNGLPICRRDHNAFHAGQPFPRSIFTTDEWAFISTLAGPGWLGRRYPLGLASANQGVVERSPFPESSSGPNSRGAV